MSVDNMGLRYVWRFLFGLTVLLAAWFAVPSSVFVQPISVALNGDTVVISRSTPFGAVTVRWLGEISLLGNRNNFECTGQGTSIIQHQADGLFTGRIGAWAQPCLNDGAPFVLRFRYQVLFLGLIPMRPVYFGTTIQEARG